MMVKKLMKKQNLVCTHSYTTQYPINTLVDICLGKEYKNHGDITINLKMVKTLDAAYRSMKSLKLEDV